jgi:hypothetical protein
MKQRQLHAENQPEDLIFDKPEKTADFEGLCKQLEN